jgi:ankyrin repeat protein
LEDIGDQNWERAHRLFQCVSAAARPLHVKELADILAFDFEVEPTPTFRAERRSEDPVHTVLSTCFSLLAVVDVDGSRVVQFAHFSVKEYLTSERLSKAKDTVSRFHVSMTPAHTIIAQGCLGILLHLNENVTKDSLRSLPLVKYAAEYWPGHARFNNVSSNILDGMKRLFDPREHHLSIWLWIYNPIYPEDPLPGPATDRPKKDPLTPLHYAAICGLCDVATFLFVERWQDLCSQVVHYDATPLHLASEFGHADFAQFLLEHGADTTAVDDTGFTPLCRASYEGHAEVARVILERGAEIDTNLNDFNWTPLQLALHYGHVETARVLLEHGADTEVRDSGGFAPLHGASASGQLAVARVLLEHGADTEIWDDRGYTPLHLASARGQLAVARILLEHGADLEARTPSGCTPLNVANEEIARFLIERGADAKALDEDGRTPLHHASERGCIKGPVATRSPLGWCRCRLCSTVKSGTLHRFLE